LATAVIKSERCCGESGTLGVTRPDISTQVRFRKEEELRKGERLICRRYGTARRRRAETANVKILDQLPQLPARPVALRQRPATTACWRRTTSWSRWPTQILGDDWLPEYVQHANAGGIERVLV